MLNAQERFHDHLLDRGVFKDGDQLREKYQSEAVDCIHCTAKVHPSLWKQHIDHHHPEAGYGDGVFIDTELRDLLPPLSDEERAGLEESIKAEGVREPIIVWSEHRLLIDGHHRWAIAQAHGIPVEVRVLDFESRDDVVIWMIRNQLHRRNVSAFVRTEKALLLKDAIARKAKLNQVAGLKQGDENPVLANLPERGEPIDTREEIAHIANTSARNVGKVEMVLRDAPEPIKAKARAGTMSVNRAHKITHALKGQPEAIKFAVAAHDVDDPDVIPLLKQIKAQEPELFEKIVETGEFGPVSLVDGARAIRAQWKLRQDDKQRVARKRAQQTPAPQGQYKTIVIDPPWPMKKIARMETRPNQGEFMDYPTMTLDEITALPVRNLAEDDAHLYLWVTQKFLPVGLKVVEQWGFGYQCVFTWVKPNGMTPFSWMYNTELCIFATRGNLPVAQKGLKLSIEAAATGHSIKPDVFYAERVLLASPEPRLEMFARKEREGFTVWGADVTPG